jgi:XTP/dITP diphosphohydrolase
MKLIIASNNKHKISEIKSILSGKFDEILSLSEAGINHETVEGGDTFIANALKKAREISAISGAAVLADDSGLCVNALSGAPGIYSARYSGEGATDEKNNALLLKNLAPHTDRSAYFICTVALVYPDGREVTSEGRVYGEIIEKRRGAHGFGYDPIFLVKGDTRTLAEVTDDEKNAISHRSVALANLLKTL